MDKKEFVEKVLNNCILQSYPFVAGVLFDEDATAYEEFVTIYFIDLSIKKICVTANGNKAILNAVCKLLNDIDNDIDIN